MINQKKVGVVFSYINIVLNMITNIFLTPFLLSSLGQAEYGLYKVIGSFSGQLSVMTFGISTLVMRNVVYYSTLNKQKDKENFLAMSVIVSFLLAMATVAIGSVMYLNVENIFSTSFTPAEMITAKKLTVLFILNIAITIVGDSFVGIVNGHEKFAVINFVRGFRIVLRVVVIVILMKLGFKSIAVIATDLALSIGFMMFNIIYSLAGLKEKIRFHYFDSEMLKTTFLFSGAFFLQAIVNQVNTNVSNLILGIMTDTKTVAVYSVAITIYSMYTTLAVSISGVFTPTATKLIAKNATSDELTNFVIKPGRYQLMIAGAIFGGFLLLGQEFIYLWLGNGYESVYYIVLILIIPMTLPLVENTTNAILDALLKRMSRSVILIITAVINILISIVLIKYIGYMGAAFGTAISVIIGQNILSNWYLYKYIKLDVFGIIKGILNKLLLCIVAVIVLLSPMLFFNNKSIIGFIIKGVIYVIVYCMAIYCFGMKKEEKQMVNATINKFIKIKREKKYVQK